jgi:hypothetical protein
MAVQFASLQTLPFQDIAQNDDKLDERIGLFFRKQGQLKNLKNRMNRTWEGGI